MRNIRFQILKILSYKEKKARILNIDNDIVLFRGSNGSGKSCVLKSLFEVLGANVKKTSEAWVSSNPIVILYFTIDNIKFKSLSIGKDVFVFNPNGEIRFKAKRGSIKLNQKLNELFGLTLLLDKQRTPDMPAGAIYMPFYIDQDSGWNETWSSFVRVGDTSERSNFAHYLTSLVKNEYFIIKNEFIEVTSELRKLQTENRALSTIVTEVKHRFNEIGVVMAEPQFQHYANAYLEKLTRLREQQNEMMRTLNNLYTRKSYLEVNIEQLHKNIRDIDEDFRYALTQDKIITCPTCGGIYKNDMSTRHEILRDKHICRDQIVEFNKELDTVRERIDAAMAENTALLEKIADVQASIRANENNVTLEQVIDDHVRKKLLEVVSVKSEDTNTKIAELVQKKGVLETQIKEYDTSGRKSLLNQEFASFTQTALLSMGTKRIDQNVKMFSKLTATGSSLPKHIVAYTFAYIKIIEKYSGPVMFPIVIDEPKQQGLNTSGLQKMVDYLVSNVPTNGQLIIALTDESVSMPKSAKVIDFKNQNHLLRDEDYLEVQEEIDELLEKDFFNINL